METMLVLVCIVEICADSNKSREKISFPDQINPMFFLKKG